MNSEMAKAREHFVQGMSRIAYFWGFPKAMGAIYGVIYLSREPLTLDDMVEQLSISKGAASTNIRGLERLGMVHKHFQVGDRKDYYTAETDFWKIIKGILREREKNEFDLALHTVDDSIKMLCNNNFEKSESEAVTFYLERLQGMKNFFDVLDNLAATVIALDELRLGTIKNLFGGAKNNL